MKILRKEDYNYSILYIENENKCSAYKRLADGNWLYLKNGDWSSVKNVDELEKAFKEINMSKLPIDDCRQPIEKEFVPYDLTLRLKVLGFEESCLAYYESQDKNLVINFNNLPLTEEQKKRPGLYTIDNRNGILPQWAVAAPTWQSAFKWLENKYNIYGIPKPILGSKNGYDSFPILGWDFDSFMTNLATENSYYMGYPIGEWFTATLERFEEGGTLSDYNIEPMTKEDAQKACLGQLITIAEYKNSRIQE
jgi:hypothetical protein